MNIRVLALCSWVCVHEEIPICGTMTNHRHSCCTQAPSLPHPAVAKIIQKCLSATSVTGKWGPPILGTPLQIWGPLRLKTL